jgi:TolA-binding protein
MPTCVHIIFADSVEKLVEGVIFERLKIKDPLILRKSSSLLIILIITLLISIDTSKAQETAVYSVPSLNFRQGIELFQLQKYGAAKEEFRLAIAEFRKEGDNNNHLQLLEALYYDALTSKLLNRPDAEKLFLDLLDGYEENTTTRLASFHLAGLYFDRKKYDKSIAWYKKVDPADLNPNEKTEFTFRYGFCYFYKKDFEKAKPFFNEIRKTKGTYYYPSNYYYGFISYKEGDFKEALEAFRDIDSSDLYRPMVPYYIANIYFNEKRYDEVIKYASGFNEADQVQYYLELQQLIGKCYFEKQQYDKAIPYFTKYKNGTAKLTKEDIYQIAFCEYKTKNYTEAISGFRELNVLRDSMGQSALYLLGDCYLKINEKENARFAFEQASKMDFDQFVKENSSFHYAKLSYDLNFHDVSISAWQHFISTFPRSSYVAEAKEYLSLEFLATQNYKEALEVLRTMDVKNSAVRKAYQKVAYSRATELFNAGESVEAVAIFDESLKNPVDQSLKAAAYFWKGQALYNQRLYNEAIGSLDLFIEWAGTGITLPENVSVFLADYTKGYCLLKQSNYVDAINYFQKVSKSPVKAEDPLLNKVIVDATLRAADCGFVLKNYETAITGYESVAAKKLPGADYALYQKSIILGLQNKATAKREVLTRIIKEYPKSIYMDDALYELGITELSVPAYQDAAAIFKQIIENYPQSNYVGKAHLKLGLIYFNLNQDEPALSEYKWVLNKYPNSPEGAEALNGVKEIFTEQGNAQGYLDYVKGIANINITDAVKDSVMYLAAENKYAKNDVSGAIREFSNYITAFPSGIFSLNAHFYRGECLFSQGDFMMALNDYDYVIRQPQSRFAEKSLLNAARISYSHKKDYEGSYKYYKKLQEIAELKANKLEAAKGMMYSAYYLTRYNEVLIAAQLVLATDVAKANDLLEAHYYQAKVFESQNELSKAFTEYAIVAKEKSAIGAEASYRMAEIYFKQQNLTAAEEQCYALVKDKPGYDYWIAKSYLLIADIFESDKDYFQAKSTLQSVIDNYKGADEIVATAKAKLISIEEQEALQSKLKQDSPAEEMELDSIPEIKTN